MIVKELDSEGVDWVNLAAGAFDISIRSVQSIIISEGNVAICISLFAPPAFFRVDHFSL
jgi:hypothetical protein